MAKWPAYMPKGYQAQKYGDTQTLFAAGKAAIVPAGSWDIAFYQQQGGIDFGDGSGKIPLRKILFCGLVMLRSADCELESE